MMTCVVFLSSFYESLFTAEATDPAIANSLLNNVSFTLPSTQADLYDGPLSSDECFAALNGMARGKLPGLGGPAYGILCKVLAHLGD